MPAEPGTPQRRAPKRSPSPETPRDAEAKRPCPNSASAPSPSAPPMIQMAVDPCKSISLEAPLPVAGSMGFLNGSLEEITG